MREGRVEGNDAHRNNDGKKHNINKRLLNDEPDGASCLLIPFKLIIC